MRRIVGFLDGVRTRAVSTGKTLNLTRDGESNRLVVREGDDVEGSIDSIVVPDGAGRFTLEPPAVLFFAQGHSSGLTLTFFDEEERISRIEVGSFTGLARGSRFRIRTATSVGTFTQRLRHLCRIRLSDPSSMSEIG